MSAPDGLFAAKGQAQPVDQTRDATDRSAKPESSTSGAVDTVVDIEAGPLPDLFGEPAPSLFGEPAPSLFGEPANDESEETSPDSDDDAENSGDTATVEPPPAASLLTIVSQRSAARRLPATPDKSKATPPDAFNEIDDDDVDTPTDTAAAEDTGPKTINLPVPVPIQLPMVIDSPAASKSGWDRRMAALAACVAISIAGAVTILIAGSAD
ncbi:MAG: hypothetical protein ACI9MU_003935, partial [Alphaproteobacteria bacterium]